MFDGQPNFFSPSSVSEALNLLVKFGHHSQIFAGGTWIMRGPIRGELQNKVLVSLSNIKKLHEINLTSEKLTVGAMVSHQDLAKTVKDISEFNSLYFASAVSANPSVRRMATIGGNICTLGFHSPDLIPALMVLKATLTFQSKIGIYELSIDEYLENRLERPFCEILTTITVPRGVFKSSHRRLLLRQAGEYPVANLSMQCRLNEEGYLSEVRIAVGSVEATPKRWGKLEYVMKGKSATKINIKSLAEQNLDEFKGRNGPDAPGWYRSRVMPRLAMDAFKEINNENS